MKLRQSDVLVYRRGRRQSTVRRHFEEWRAQQSPPISIRCDNRVCVFHSTEPVWNGTKLKLVLDHKNGVSGDNRPNNLQLLCPNCAHQLGTHGGGNKGKVEQDVGGFAHLRRDGKRDYTLPAEPGHFKVTGAEVKLITSRK